MSLLPAVAGGGVPVGAYGAHGMLAVANDPTASVELVPALWAATTPHKAVWRLCQAQNTKNGEPCESTKVRGTVLCYGHWSVLAASFGRGLVNAVGAANAVKRVK